VPIVMQTREVGPWPMNTYLLICEETRKSVVVDPGADPDVIFNLAKDTTISKILITHGHPDHIQALDEIKGRTNALVYVNDLDADKFGIQYDIPLMDEGIIAFGESRLRAIFTPGHTPGSTSFDLGDGRIIVGDTIFVGGPGHTSTPDDFLTTMHTMQHIVFSWSDETLFFPGHGAEGTIGAERAAFENFMARGWSDNLFGDVTWVD
jgi:hydroxyacylglutathione hydrolase